jgi:hypothetical protein
MNGQMSLVIARFMIAFYTHFRNSFYEGRRNRRTEGRENENLELKKKKKERKPHFHTNI